MYIVLANEIADVDLTEFEKVGSFHEGVIAVPNIDICLTLKGMPTSLSDQVEDCQHSLSLVFEAPWDDEESETILLEDSFAAGIIYRRRHGESSRAIRDFVELRYKHCLGALTLYVYFLVAANDCFFGYQEEGETHIGIDYASLWKQGHVREVT